MAICQRRRASLDSLKHQLDNIDDPLWQGTHSGHFFSLLFDYGRKTLFEAWYEKKT